MAQVITPATELFNRLATIYDETPALSTMNGRNNWPGSKNAASDGPCHHHTLAQDGVQPAEGSDRFGAPLSEIRVIMVHEVDGWGPRNGAESLSNRYVTANFHEGAECKWGIGPQFYVSVDGSVFRLIEMDPNPLEAWHGNGTNGWAIGVETGHNNGGGNNTDTHPPTSFWRALSENADLGVDDLPGLKVWVREHFGNPNNLAVHPGQAIPTQQYIDSLREPYVGWWTTTRFAGPWREAQRFPTMIFSDEQYYAWALLARWLCEAYLVPRNFPLYPHAQRSGEVTNPDRFRAIVLADEGYPSILRALAPVNAAPHNVTAGDFDFANLGTLNDKYARAVVHGDFPSNRLWTAMFSSFRGLHGHAFSGVPSRGEHDCPGPMFDWFRFARQVWDWWWYPFDFDARGVSTATPMRVYRNWTGGTPAYEYYYDLPAASYAARITNGLQGASSSPTTFRLEYNSPLYALANGELVAARYPTEETGVNLAFLLVRHEVFFQPEILAAMDLEGFFGDWHIPERATGRVDYNQPPMTVYSLYMHLAYPDHIKFDGVSDDNPDWLNRVIKRKLESHLGTKFQHDDAAKHPPQISAAAWASRPPGTVVRPTRLEAWNADEAGLQTFLDNLRGGQIAFPPTAFGATPIRIILGDYLGPAGTIGFNGTDRQFGVRVEVFSTTPPPNAFTLTGNAQNWSPPAGSVHPCLQYQSEWSRPLSDADRAALSAKGVLTDFVTWWPDVAAVPWTGLPADGIVYHYDPLDFMRWLNEVTRASEWPKYKVVDDTGQAAPLPAAPRTRRV